MMRTEIITDNIPRASEIIRHGGLAAVPTETVYGLAANGLDAAAVEKIYEVKGRPAIKPLSLMVPDAGAMEKYCTDVPAQAHMLAEKFWPGPLTIILKSKPVVPDIVRAGGGTVGLRCPDHAKTLALLRECGVPLAAPSANPSGKPSPRSAEAVMDYFAGAIDAVIDGGTCSMGVESTILDMSCIPYRILRQGALPAEDIGKALMDGLKVIGITGGTGCGKTTALDVLKDMGALVLDCDEVYHELTLTSVEMRAELTARFGDIYDGSALDRKKLGAVVFSDPGALADLNAITHKYVDMEINSRLTQWAMSGGTVAAVDAIALIGSGIDERCIATVGITAPTETRVQRLIAREGISEEYARLRISAQKPNEYFEKNCTLTINNDSTREAFAEKCRRAFSGLL